MKWIGRIFYFIFVLLILGFVEVTLMGVTGMMRSEYASTHIIDAMKNNESYTTFEGLDRYNAALETYYSKDQIKTSTDQLYYDTTNNTEIDAKYQVKLGIYPFISLIKDPNVDIYYDGFYIVLESYSEDALYYSIEVTAYNVNDPEKTKVVLNGKDTEGNEVNAPYLNIYTSPDGFISNQRVPLTTYLFNPHFYTDAQKTLEGTNEYHILAVDLYAHFDQETEPAFIYRITDGTETYQGSPMVLDETLNITPESYNFSKLLDGMTPTQENNPYNLVLTYHPADFSQFTYFYFIVYGIYALLIVIIPYFWFFHKRVMKAIRNKKDGGNNDNTPQQPQIMPTHRPLKSNQQIFSDTEPKSDK
ncbi:hypothetical protein [Acholeplasma granularum]|uniref:hypothetical protein n=1 Tax=Acholeplasma granularum TaxID=264635 RepID=UPI00047024DD|nr:hypothetical protein [Acholeplasma granularum]